MNSSDFTLDELATGLELIIEKNRDSLAVEEINLLTETIKLITELSNPEIYKVQKLRISTTLNIILNLLKFFDKCREIVEMIDVL